MLLETLGVRLEPSSWTDLNNKEICFRLCHSGGFLHTGRVKNSCVCLLNQFPGKNSFIPDDKLSFLLSQPVAFLIHTSHITRHAVSVRRDAHKAADEI